MATEQKGSDWDLLVSTESEVSQDGCWGVTRRCRALPGPETTRLSNSQDTKSMCASRSVGILVWNENCVSLP